MIDMLEAIEEKFNNIDMILRDTGIISNQERYQKYAKEYSELSKIINPYREYKKVCQEIDDNKNLLNDSDDIIKELAKDEIQELEKRKLQLEKELKSLLIPKDPNDERNILLEIRAGAGGEEAALFVADLFRMYSKYAEERKWRIEIMSHNLTGVGGFKEIIASIEGKGVYSKLKYESGVHRVQRIPITESQGRIHTSTATVAVLPEAEDIEVQINQDDLRIDVFRSSGPGGQSVNTTDSAVRITHIPTGLVVTCQDEKSQHKNKSKALRVLKARLYDMLLEEQREEISRIRRSQVGKGDRSERIRTYNFPQGRVTDHRIGLSLHKLEDILEGRLDGLIEALTNYYQAESLKMVI